MKFEKGDKVRVTPDLILAQYRGQVAKIVRSKVRLARMEYLLKYDDGAQGWAWEADLTNATNETPMKMKDIGMFSMEEIDAAATLIEELQKG